jgi:2-polyprenyl-3-methyl-5-hydroxy-6-metoxy-1,4-benzoquinol methylase
MRDTAGAEYTRRLQRLSGARWKRFLDVQAPYRWNLRRLDLGRTLDIGCGIGRNLAHLDGDGAVGVDHNASSVHACRAQGFEAYTVEEFQAGPHARAGAFDSLLAAHLVEHMTEPEAVGILGSYLPYLRPGGRVVLITPQERGQVSDPTHVRFVDFGASARLAASLGLIVERQYSFPLPRAAGTLFRYNEFVTIANRGAAE